MDLDFAYSFKNPQLYGNWLMDVNPLNKFNFSAVMAAVGFILPYWWIGYAMMAGYLVLAAIAGKFGPFFKMFYKVFLLVGAILFLMRAMFTEGTTILFSWGNIHVTVESIFYGLRVAGTVVAFCGAVILFYNITPMRDLMYSLERIGVSHETSYICLASMQAITDLGESSKVIMDSQKARGIETEGGLISRMKAFIPIIGPLVLGAISNTEEKSIAMDARAFSAPVKHTFLRELRKTPAAEKAAIILIDIALVAVIVGRIIWL